MIRSAKNLFLPQKHNNKTVPLGQEVKRVPARGELLCESELQIIAAGDDLTPFHGADGAVLLDAELPLEGEHGAAGRVVKYTCDIHVGDLRVVPGDDVKIALDNAHTFPGVSLHQKAAGVRLADGALVIGGQFADRRPVGGFQRAEGTLSDNAVHCQSVERLEGIDRVAGLFPEIACDGNGGKGGEEVAEKGEIILHRLHIHAAVAQLQSAGVAALHLGDLQPFARHIRKALDGGEYLLDFIPCRLADNAVGFKVENLLKSGHRLLGFKIIHAGELGNGRKGGVIAADGVQLPLDGQHIVPEGTAPQRRAGIGRRVVGDRRVANQLNVVPKIVLQDFKGGKTLIGETDAAPLGQSAALGIDAVAELRVQRDNAAVAHDVIVEDFVHDLADVVENLPIGDKGLVVLGVVGDVEVVAAAGVIFGVDSVEREGDLREYVGAKGGFRPVGVNLAGRDVFDVFGKTHGDVFRLVIGAAEMHRDGLGNHRNRRHLHPLRSLLGDGGERHGQNGFDAVVDRDALVKDRLKIGVIERYEIMGFVRVGSFGREHEIL